MRSITINDYIYGLIIEQNMTITLIIIIITCLVSITTFSRPMDMEKLSFSRTGFIISMSITASLHQDSCMPTTCTWCLICCLYIL